MGFFWFVEAHLSRWRTRPGRPQGQPQIARSVPNRVAVIYRRLLCCIFPELACPRDRAMGSSGSLPPPTEGRKEIQSQPTNRNSSMRGKAKMNQEPKFTTSHCGKKLEKRER